MILPFTHPTLDQLAELNAAAADQKREDVAAHVRDCVRCQEALRFVRRVNEAGESVPAAQPPADLLARALAARERGARSILPATATVTAGRARWARIGAALAAAVIVIAVVVARSSDLVAEGADSSMRLTPAAPRDGDRIEIAYRPAAGLFVGHDSLVLRARYRKAGDRSYSYGMPASQLRPATTLKRSRTGEFRGSFNLPRGVVFASYAVETPDASAVDANGMRLWETIVHAADGRPLFDALDQRANDMMGRSWEEAYGSAKRATELYPERIGGWTYREFFERSMYGDAGADSIGKEYSAKRDSLIAAARAGAPLTEDDIGSVFYRVSAAARRGASQAQRDALAYWLDRVKREHPRHEQYAQHVAFDFPQEKWTDDPRFILDSLERAYQNLAPLKGPGFNVTTAARQAASRVKDDAAYRRWYERSLAGAGDSAMSLALMLADQPSSRVEGMARLRAVAVAPDIELVPRRSIFWNAEEYGRRVKDARQQVLVSLGRALIAEGQTRAGLDTLTLASQGTWNVQIFRSLLAGYVAAGDRDNADRVRVRLAVDPRTNVDSAAALAQGLRARSGSAWWDSASASARAEMHALLLERSKLKTLRAAAVVDDATGARRTIAELANGKPAVVILWSKDCGWAVDALPQIIATAKRLHEAGTPVILVNTSRYTKEVADYLAEKNWTLPVYYDTRGQAGEALNNFGVPAYYVLDGAGRVRFDSVDGVPELIAQVGAVN